MLRPMIYLLSSGMFYSAYNVYLSGTLSWHLNALRIPHEL